MELLYIFLIIICIVIFYKYIKYLFRDSNKIYHYDDLYGKDNDKEHYANIKTKTRYNKLNIISDITHYKNLILTQNDVLDNFNLKGNYSDKHLDVIKGIYYYIKYDDYMEFLNIHTSDTISSMFKKKLMFTHQNMNDETFKNVNDETFKDIIHIYCKYYRDSQGYKIYLLLFLEDTGGKIDGKKDGKKDGKIEGKHENKDKTYTIIFTDLFGNEILRLKYQSNDNSTSVKNNTFNLKDCSEDIYKQLLVDKSVHDIDKNLIYNSLNAQLNIKPTNGNNNIGIFDNMYSSQIKGRNLFLYGINKNTDLYHLENVNDNKIFKRNTMEPIFTHKEFDGLKPHSFYLYGNIFPDDNGEPYCSYDRSFLDKLNVKEEEKEESFIRANYIKENIKDITKILKKYILENNFTYLYSSYNSYIYLSDKYNMYIKLLINNENIQNDFSPTYNKVKYTGRPGSNQKHKSMDSCNDVINNSLSSGDYINDSILESIFTNFQIYIGYINIERFNKDNKDNKDNNDEITTQGDLKIKLINIYNNKNNPNNINNPNFIDLYNLHYDKERITFKNITTGADSFGEKKYNVKMNYYLTGKAGKRIFKDIKYDYYELSTKKFPVFKFKNLNISTMDIDNIFDIIHNDIEEEEEEEEVVNPYYDTYGSCFQNSNVAEVRSCFEKTYNNNILGDKRNKNYSNNITSIITETNPDKYCWGFFILPEDLKGISKFDIKSNNYVKDIIYYKLIIPRKYQDNPMEFYNNIDRSSIEKKNIDEEEEDYEKVITKTLLFLKKDFLINV